MWAQTHQDAHRSHDPHDVSLNAETDDEEEYLIPMQGTILAFALAMNEIVDLYEDPMIKATLRQFRPKKYLAVVRGSHESFHREGHTVHLLFLASRPVGANYPRISDQHDEPSWYEGIHVAMGSQCPVPDNGRPMLSCSPPLPWSNCILYTALGSGLEMGTLHAVEGDPCRLSQEDFNRMTDYFVADHKVLEQRRTRAQDAWRAAKVERAEIITPASAAEFAKKRLPPVTFIVDLWEDLSDLTEALYPGDFEAECVELQRLVQKATEEALEARRSQVLADPEPQAAVAAPEVEHEKGLMVSKEENHASHGVANSPEEEKGKSDEQPERRPDPTTTDTTEPNEQLEHHHDPLTTDTIESASHDSIEEKRAPITPPTGNQRWWRDGIKPEQAGKVLRRVAFSATSKTSDFVRKCRKGISRICNTLLCGTA